MNKLETDFANNKLKKTEEIYKEKKIIEAGLIKGKLNKLDRKFADEKLKKVKEARICPEVKKKKKTIVKQNIKKK